MGTFGHRAWLFLLFALAICLIWVSFGPLVREVTVNILNRVNWTTAASYVNSA